MTLVKICGITNLADALAAVEADADLLGFNFYRRSPRFIEPLAARAIIEQLPASVINVGVFVNEELKEIEEIASVSGVSVLQLHGDESTEYCVSLRAHGRTIMKVFSTKTDFSPDKVRQYDVPLIMLDAAAALRGGTGTLSDWSMARRTRKLFPTLFLAGGLSPQNIAGAIEEVKPFGVDACSALEQAPGKKDHTKVREFVAAVRSMSSHPLTEWEEN
ncbi:MAG TPA: phosphoribosylanthranilate isomerase [Pyrinomonadaceae bacterium]|nr:phosphoribosylanthranilate isomerase [Pyrinomonadaceae bacterium]